MVVRSVLTAVGERLGGKHAERVIRHQLLTEVPVLRDRDLAKRAATEELVAEHLAQRLGVDVDHDVRPRWWAGVAFATFAAGYQTWLAQGGSVGTSRFGRSPARSRQDRAASRHLGTGSEFEVIRGRRNARSKPRRCYQAGNTNSRPSSQQQSVTRGCGGQETARSASEVAQIDAPSVRGGGQPGGKI